MRKQTALIVSIATLILIVIAACGRSSDTDIEPNSAAIDASVPTQSGQVVTAGAQITPTLDQSSGSPTRSSDSIDPNAIVAAFEQVLGDIYETVLPSVVQVKVRNDVGQGGLFGIPRTPGTGEGSGFVWSDDGYVVTNHHVIDGAGSVYVVFADGSEFEAKVMGSDPSSDLAVLQIVSPPAGLEEVTLGDSDDLSVGQIAVAIGSPFGQEFSMTRGIISALGRVLQAGDSLFRNPEIIQTDAPINPGNSGGPLLSRTGEVIGINSQIISRSGGSSGVGFAVPINTAKRVVPELIANGEHTYAYLGISGRSVTPSLAEANGLPKETRGVLIVEVVAGGPAERAGLSGATSVTTRSGVPLPTEGEIITSIDGRPIEGMDELIVHLAENKRPGDLLQMEVITSSGTTTVDVTLAARPRRESS